MSRRPPRAPEPAHALARWQNLRVTLERPRWRAAMIAALVSDALSFGLEAASLGLAEPAQLVVDLATAAVLAYLLGMRWGLVVALVAEAVPGVAALPAWTAVVAAYAAADRSNEPPSADAS